MIKHFVKHGNSWAIVIDRPILDLLKINPAEPVERTSDGAKITIATVAPAAHNTRVPAARQKVNTRYQAAFKKLAE